MTALSSFSGPVPTLTLADAGSAAPKAVPSVPRSLYLLALHPPAAFLRPTQAGLGMPLEAFWEIARFSAPPSMEATLERWLQRLLGQERGFGLRWQAAVVEQLLQGAALPPSPAVRLHQPNALRELALRIQTLQPFLESCGGTPLSFGFRPGQAIRAGQGSPLVPAGELAVSAIYLLRQSADGPLEQVAVLGLRP